MYGEEDARPLVVAGSINADLVAEVARLPRPGETMDAKGFNVYPGGKVGRARPRP